jgi:hypothetical protein
VPGEVALGKSEARLTEIYFMFIISFSINVSETLNINFKYGAYRNALCSSSILMFGTNIETHFHTYMDRVYSKKLLNKLRSQ